jgi:hypothetical protein
MLHALGVVVNARERKRLHDALAYWAALTLCHSSWHLAKRDGHVRKILPPAVESFEIIGRRIKVKLSQAWTTLHLKGYFARVPLPLPDHAAAQNIVLLMATRMKQHLSFVHDGKEVSGEGWKYSPGLLNLCTKVGLAHSSRRHVLRRLTIYEGPLHKWYASHGLMLVAVNNNGRKKNNRAFS